MIRFVVAISLCLASAVAVAQETSDTQLAAMDTHVQRTLARGRQIFRFDTFGDQAFWGDTIKLHQAIEGTSLGGVGSGVSPKTALAVGLKVDVAALPQALIESLKAGQVNLDDPATTLALLKLNAVVGVTGFFAASGRMGRGGLGSGGSGGVRDFGAAG